MSKILFFLTCSDKTGIEYAIEHESSSDQVAICLLQDAVYNANKANILIQKFIKKGQVYAGKEDVDKRGLDNYIDNSIKLLNYSEIIDLVLEQDNIINL